MEVYEIKEILEKNGYQAKICEGYVLGRGVVPIEIYFDKRGITKIVGIYPDHDGPDGNREVDFGTNINKIPPNFCPPPAYIENSEAL